MNASVSRLTRRALARGGLGLAALSGYAPRARAAAPGGAPIRIGILHSLSGTMAISETTLKDVMLMLVAEQNRRGGVLGRPLEAVVVDPASNWPLYAEKARQLIAVDRVSAIFGCWTSVSRKSVLPVVEELNGILFYPVQYEGQECSRNIFYTGAAPNQQAIPAVDYLLGEEGGAAKRFALIGTDYVYPRTTNQILRNYLLARGITPGDIMIDYTPFGQSDWQTSVSRIKAFGSAGKKTAVISTVNGDANVPFYKELGNQGVSATDIPVMAFSVGEEELAGMDTGGLVGQLAAWNYFQSIDTPQNTAFIRSWRDFTGNPKRTANDPMEAHYLGFNLWVQAVTKAGTTDSDAVIDAMVGLRQGNLTGGTAVMLPDHHLSKPVYIGEIQDDGQFAVVWQTPAEIPGEAWSRYVPETRTLVGDWTAPRHCGNYDTARKLCLGGRHG
ncbi:urea ABC transporter substrate-binding protein [Swaminathania salitolerans]|uniref:ABC transporter substrate-binding protein n=1 Tax=Swaminathania salitolerans TaxID=182838 RepID=A0A511BN31_9PROT|nr:urea ABC transporter substrate-binding protein [Swaminathania salitolerans]GBQ13799.1 urea short-chain amide or branched-chain amino acid transporter periplasmic substrate-binding protein [Swaminathania salitolerans LMG 21291]GEL01731.1 ABC transporter substrate-binding protein [Swaminathania salitolerans]